MIKKTHSGQLHLSHCTCNFVKRTYLGLEFGFKEFYRKDLRSGQMGIVSRTGALGTCKCVEGNQKCSVVTPMCEIVISSMQDF